MTLFNLRLLKLLPKHALRMRVIQTKPEVELMVVQFIPLDLSILVLVNHLECTVSCLLIKGTGLHDNAIFIEGNTSIMVCVHHIVPGMIQLE